MSTKLFENYTMEDFKSFFSIASSVIVQNLSVSTRQLDTTAQKMIDRNIFFVYEALKECQLKGFLKLKKKTHFPAGSLGDAFERVVDTCAQLKIPATYQIGKNFVKPLSVEKQVKLERLRLKRKKFLKNNFISNFFVNIYQKTKKEK